MATVYMAVAAAVGILEVEADWQVVVGRVMWMRVGLLSYM